MEDYISELTRLIQNGKVEPAREKLRQLNSRPDPERHKVIELLALAPDKTALALMDLVLEDRSTDPETWDSLFQLLIDRAHLYFPFALIVLKHADPSRLLPVAPLFRHILAKETRPDILGRIIRKAGIYRLHPLTDDIAEFIFYDDPELKALAVTALERMGTKQACRRLEQIAATQKADPDILDALEFLKTTLFRKEEVRPEPGPVQAAPSIRPVDDPAGGSYETHLARLFSGKADESCRAIQYFCEHGPQAAKALSLNLESFDHDLLVTLIWTISLTLPPAALQDLFTLISGDLDDSLLKFSIYNALEAYPELKSSAMIVKGLSEPALFVRMAAANVLERHCSDYIVAEIKQKIESGSKAGEELVRTILDIRAPRLIHALLASDTFSYIASNYLETKASPAVLDAYIRILENRNLKSSLKRFQRLREKKAGSLKPVIMVVSPSKSYLDVYARLIYSSGFEPRTFTGTQEAFEAMMAEKPAALVCNLILNNMTCREFAGEARGIYSRQELPLLVSPLVRNLESRGLDKALFQAGVSGLVEFPARTSQIKSWIRQN